MSGPSVKIPTDWLDSDQVEDLGSDAVMLMITALGYAARQTSNGVVPRRRLRKLWPVDDLDDAIERLTAAGELEDQGDDVLFLRWRDFILAQDEVEAIRESSRVRTERSRRHRGGDHSMCRAEYCTAAKRHKSRDGDVTARVSDGHPTRPDPTRPLGRGEGEGDASSASAVATTAELADEIDTPVEPHTAMPEPYGCAWCQDPSDGLNVPGDIAYLAHNAHQWRRDDDPLAPDGWCADCGEQPDWHGHHYAQLWLRRHPDSERFGQVKVELEAGGWKEPANA